MDALLSILIDVRAGERFTEVAVADAAHRVPAPVQRAPVQPAIRVSNFAR
ncbi:MAG: hypothetical protein QM674_11295 [Burkholderiaceae bacterium]